MEGEINNLIKCWLQVVASSCYCYLVAKILPKGTTRLISFFPVICLFCILPLSLTSVHLEIITGYIIAWLANFKLLLFAFSVGPLSDPSLSLGRFISLHCFPVVIKKSPSRNSSKHITNPSLLGLIISPIYYATKAVLLHFLYVMADHYKDQLHTMVFHFLMTLYIYVVLEIVLAMTAFLARILMRSELKPQFRKPYLSVSLKDYWGRQWNLVSSDILRSTVFNPVLNLSKPIIGQKWAPIIATLVALLVSGFMHELIFYYVCRLRPTWGTTLYFVLNGVFMIIEGAALKKNYAGSWRLPRLIIGPLIFSFVMICFALLVLPDLLRCDADVRAKKEFEAVGTFVRDLILSGGNFKPSNISSVCLIN